MKKILFMLIALCCVSSLAFAEDLAEPVASMDIATSEVLTLQGDIIDNMCAGMNKDTLAEFVKVHTKECALKPACMATGYAIFANGKLSKFDKDSNAKVAEFLNKADSKLQVTVTAKQVGDELSLVSIENQK